MSSRLETCHLGFSLQLDRWPTMLTTILITCLILSGVEGKSRGEETLGERYINRADATKMREQLSKRGPGYGTDWIMIPDGEGQPQVAILKQDAGNRFLGLWDENNARDNSETTNNTTEDIRYHLYTRKNPAKGHTISPLTPDSLRSSSFDGSKPTKIIIHGWKSSGGSSTVLNIKDAYLERSDVNVVGVDWSNIASSNYYFTPVGEIPNVGENIAKMIDMMAANNGARYQDFHIIGHSLGAHVAGAAGSKTKKKVSRITGLDPALPGFQYWQGPDGRLDETDGNFVQVIHTCSGALGMSDPAGHADFYPNGGSPFQPGCCCLAEFTESCSHGRSHQYFAESIRSKAQFQAAPCPTWDHFKNGACGKNVVSMGEPTSSKTRGVFYLMTNSTAPYSLGPIGAKYFEYDDY